MTAQEKDTIEAILVNVGLESLHTADGCEDSKTKPLITKLLVVKTSH